MNDDTSDTIDYTGLLAVEKEAPRLSTREGGSKINIPAPSAMANPSRVFSKGL